ncbi:MAG TPA: 4-alpha-glucanotransferase [Acidimicrobiales bacterium]|nr:4-alpha-glucanotransferase [Acidimicrobiales bacterium]
MSDGRAWGVQEGYNDDRGTWHDTPAETTQALLDAMGAGDRPPPPASAPPGDGCRVLVVAEGEEAEVGGQWLLRTEDGGDAKVDGRLLPDVPLGYHRLERQSDGLVARLVVAPPACDLPPGLRTWGWALQLYATRSRASWGMGDLADLGRIGRWSTGHGAGMAMINPLHAAQPAGAQQASPYSPSSRSWRNPLYLRVEDVPGFDGLAGGPDGADLRELAAAGRALNDDRLIDRDRVWSLKSTALERLWTRFRDSGGDPVFDRFCDHEGPSLAAYATFCAIAERHGVPWTDWPAELHDPDGAAVVDFAGEHRERVRYHQWLQWLVDSQLRQAGQEIAVVQDLAIGVDPGGADAWLWQDCVALDVRVGAPPDEFAFEGQDWGLPPFDPWRLRRAGYEPFISTLRSMLRHGGGVRIDHVMGLFRLFWIPPGRSPSEGAYVSYPWRDLLGILALESVRAGAWVVGEDLGTVEPFVREELGRRNVLSYRLAWFEGAPPRRFPERAMAAVTTHDLPTVAGLWTGADLEEQERLGRNPNVESTLAIRRRLEEWTGVDGDAPVDDVVQRTYQLLAEAPSAVLAATLDDALGVPERPNLPGTTSERPNWCLALPVPLDDIEHDPRVAGVARALAEGRTSTPE